MNFEKTLLQTQNRLSNEGSNMGNLLEMSKKWTPETLIGEDEWKKILGRARNLPISMGAFPFGFEFPLHSSSPGADFGVSLTGGTPTSNIFCGRAKSGTDKLAEALAKLFERMDCEDSKLPSIVGQKVMLEFDIGSAKKAIPELPGFFLRPGSIPIIGGEGQFNDILTVTDALFSSVGWELDLAEKRKLEQIYRSQPNGTRMDSFGIFPSRSRGIRLAVMGINSSSELNSFLRNIDWPGNSSTVQGVVKDLQEHANIVQNGVNLDVQGENLGSVLGLTAMVKKRYTNDPRYWLDDTDLWYPFLDVLSQVDIVIQGKLSALKGWTAKPELFYGKTGRFVVLRGIHHVKMVFSDGVLSKVKAYVFMVLTSVD